MEKVFASRAKLIEVRWNSAFGRDKKESNVTLQYNTIVIHTNEHTACFPANKWKFDKTHIHCSVSLSEAMFYVAKSQLLYMECPSNKRKI